MPERQAADLTAVTINLHAGGATPAVRQVVGDAGAQLASLQEVRNLDRLRGAVPKDWQVWPGDDVIGTAIAWDTDRFRFLSGRNTLITPGRGEGAPRLGWTPERRLTMVRLRDTVTGRIVVPYNVHLWAIGHGEGADWRYAGHVDQVETTAAAAERHRDHAVVLSLSDHNEDLEKTDPGPKSILTQYAAVGLRPSFQLLGRPAPHTHGAAALDEVFWRTRPFIEVTDARVIHIDSPHADHKARAATARIRPLKETR